MSAMTIKLINTDNLKKVKKRGLPFRINPLNHILKSIRMSWHKQEIPPRRLPRICKFDIPCKCFD